MAAFQFSVQQVSFPSESISLHSSLDSLSSVVDPNVDFNSKNESSGGENEIKVDIAEEWKSSNSASTKRNYTDVIQEGTHSATKPLQNKILLTKESLSSYPTISLEVAQHMNQNNPKLCLEAEKYFNFDSLQLKQDSSIMDHIPEVSMLTSPFHTMSMTTEALALQQSVIGNSTVKPVSADIVAQVVANTRLRIEQGASTAIKPPADSINLFDQLHKLDGEISINKNSEVELKSELIRYPSNILSSTVEKRSWFSKAPTELKRETLPQSFNKTAHNENTLHESSSHSSINSVGRKKSHRTNENNLPKLHSSNNVTPKFQRYDVSSTSCYEVYPDSSAEYETESSVSEKFELESLCSEAFETESNFSEISGNYDDFPQMKGNLDILNQTTSLGYDSKTAHVISNLPLDISNNLKSVLETSDKSTATEESNTFQLLREKAILEGRLESVIQEQDDLIKQKDHYSALATAYEAQLKSLQNQLDATVTEKKNTLLMFDAQSKENKNWDNIIKEYQDIIEAKNTEIRALKDDISQSEQANTRSKINYEELKVDLESREGAIAGLKKKIAELHVEVQVLLQGKIQMENEVKNVRLEMDTLQKSKEWFQQQLHSAQENRNRLHQQLISKQSSESLANNHLERLLAEKNLLKQELTNTQQRAVAEKEVLMKQLETIEADMKERESLFDDIQKDKGSVEAVLVERIRKMEEEKSHLTNLSFVVSNQEHELNVLKGDCDEKAKLIQALVKEKAELNRQVAILQKSSNDKDLNVQQLLQEVKDLNIKMSHNELALRSSEELVSQLKDERTAADVALASVNEEKRVMDESLKTVSENLVKFKNNFKHIKAECIAQRSQTEQLFKEKRLLEESMRKNEESMFLSHREFEQQVLSESQTRNVMYDDLKKKKCDVENVLNVYSKDLLNYQHSIENLNKQKVELTEELSNLKDLAKHKDDKITILETENDELKVNLLQLKNVRLCEHENNHIDNGKLFPDESLKELEVDSQVVQDQKSSLTSKSKLFLHKKLKEKIRECKFLRTELEKCKQFYLATNQCSNCSETCDGNEHSEKKTMELEILFKEHKALLDEKVAQLKENEKIIIELEREKGKAIGVADKYDNLKQRLLELENKLSERDAQSVQLSCIVEDLKGQIADLNAKSQAQVSNFECDMSKERTLVKSLRQQVFQEKRTCMHLQRDLQSLTSALDQANQIADSKKQEIEALHAELSLKVESELKHRAEIEYFQTEIHLQKNIVEKLNKELEEVKARDPALAEQIKAISWRLKEKTNEVVALQEKIKLMEERYQAEIDGMKKNMQETDVLLGKIRSDLDDTRKEKFNYQSKVVELRKALKTKLTELESKGILRVEKNSNEGPIIHLNIPDPEVSFDETYINDLLQKSMHLSESRPLSNLQECLNSLKEEMVQLQKKIINSSEKV